MEPTAATETTSTQIFGALYSILTELVDPMVPNSGPWSLLGQSHLFYGGLYPLAWLHPILDRPIPPPIPGFLKVALVSPMADIIYDKLMEDPSLLGKELVEIKRALWKLAVDTKVSKG
ncbi:hypothetical protein DSO57_1032580 [Entomophthora muscae]|uniref:Uncharacterized protein n=1 Tax=Entomophthora muscae TaxID=34485 RepID=A0ACC2TYI0_9FUNG|nr:hypothetical protein DSO57_1032580 [Entomophthora muscae]